MFKLISLDNFEFEVLEEKRPVLLAYIRRDYEHYIEQTEILEGISKEYGDALKICLLDEKFGGAYRRLGIEGDPTFIGYHEGKEKRRMLGKADRETLNSFVLRTLPNIQEGKDHDESTCC